jgi:transposase
VLLRLIFGKDAPINKHAIRSDVRDNVVVAISADVVESLRAKFSAVLPHLDERQQRLVMAGEARSLGHGGIAAVAGATGVSRSRISQGVAELEAGVPPLGRARRTGGGRKSVTDTDPGLLVALLALVEPTRRGDPESSLCWTTLSTRNLADELTAAGHKVGSDTVGRLLHEQGFSLQANSKTLEGGGHPDRDAQFSYINDQTADHLAAGDPVISVDTKKKELVGEYKNGGREWRPAGEPDKVKVHDFIDRNLGKANPYGVYDLAADTGWVSVGTDHDTAAFAVETIRRWWNTMGANTYPTASRVLITADGGGSNGSRTRLWKTELATLAAQTGLTLTVCHLPPGTSKWNKIEHRLFSHISMNWRGRPLTSHEVIVQTIAATTTRAGLSVHAELDTSDYPTGLTIPDSTMKALSESGTLTRHEWHPEWNYSLKPATT